MEPLCEEVDATTYLPITLFALVLVLIIISSWSHLVRNKRGLPWRADFAPTRDDDHLLRGSVSQAPGLKVLLYIYTYTSGAIYIYIHMYMYMYIYIYTCMCVCVCVCVCVCITEEVHKQV